MPQAEITAFWKDGVDSCNDPAFIGKNNLAWGINGLHRGGRFRTRPGFREAIAAPLTGVQTDGLSPQGGIIFKPLNGTWYKVIAHAGIVHYSPFPFLNWSQLPNVQFYPYSDHIIFEIGIKSNITNPDGSITFVPEPYPVLMMQDGFTRAAFWDGTTSGHTNQIPIGQAMKWNGNRLWIGDGHKLHACNEGDPLNASEEAVVASGGFFTVPGDITAIGETPDQQALLVFTDETTTSFQSSILDRTAWRNTPGFQSDLFKKIGCVGPLAVVNQYGITWWMSHKGIIGLDTALQTYRTRRIRYADTGLMRSKKMLHKNLRRVCAGQVENFVFFSWPSGDRFNAHTVVMDQTSFEPSAGEQSAGQQSSWAGIWKGIRPVQWMTGVINGQERCFALSRDYAPNLGSDYVIGIWEAFCPQRADVLLDGTVKRISVLMETRQLAFSADPKKIVAIEADPSEVRNTVNATISFVGRRSGLYTAGQKTMQASQRSPDPTIIDEYAPQQRVVRSNTILSADVDRQSVQSGYNQNIDLGFGVVLQWIGDMAIDAVRMFFEPQPKMQLGANETNESTALLLDWANNETRTDQPPPAVYPAPQGTSFIDTITTRYTEPFYSSR